MLARKFANYRLHMAGIAQNKQKCLIFIVEKFVKIKTHSKWY